MACKKVPGLLTIRGGYDMISGPPEDRAHSPLHDWFVVYQQNSLLTFPSDVQIAPFWKWPNSALGRTTTTGIYNTVLFVLAKLRNDRIKASEEVIAKSLVGDYRPEHLFTLRQSLAAYRNYQNLIDECDREIRGSLEQFKPPSQPDTSQGDSQKPQPKKPSTEGVLRSELKRVFGIDLTTIPGIRVGIAQTLFGEIGPDFTKFRSASAFASWMGLCPDNDISGGKVLWVGTRKVNCRAATALRMAAQPPQ